MKVGEIAAKLEGALSGDPDIEIVGLASIGSVSDNKLAFAKPDSDPAIFDSIPSNACILIHSDSNLAPGCAVIRVADPKLAFAKIALDLIPKHSAANYRSKTEAHTTSDVRASHVGNDVSIGQNVTIGEGSVIHDGVRIGDNTKIGDQTTLHPNVVIYEDCTIGNGCVLHAGVVIGAEGFGYIRDGDDIIKFPQIGTVVLEDEVEIGANSCIDRGALGETRIGAKTKIDNLVQIAHNVSIGKRVLIASQVGISGSVVIENDVVIGGQVGIADHVTIKQGAVLGARSAVFPGKIVRPGIWAGSPVQPIKKYKEQNALIRSLGRLNLEIKEIRKKLK
jgi:UDP-3-O-[3-hydroxymyristoyl] glucosamine N-acyltransferase